VTVIRSRAGFAIALLIILCGVGSAASDRTELPAGDLVKAVIRSEMNHASGSDVRWIYVSDKEVDGKRETRDVVETKSGSLDRLVAIGGRPLSGSEQRAESDRILKFSHDSDAQRQLEQSRRKDAEQCSAFLQMIPDAFVFAYDGARGDLLQLTLKPNPRFQASTREARVLHEMSGEIWVDARQKRLVSISGQLMNDVKFAGGLLGHLEKGGQFKVTRSEVSPGHWEVQEISVNMHGKVLLFKSICVQQKEIHSQFQAVPDDLSMFDAAGLLLKQAIVAEKR
jgi:hypothetical protein